MKAAKVSVAQAEAAITAPDWCPSVPHALETLAGDGTPGAEASSLPGPATDSPSRTVGVEFQRVSPKPTIQILPTRFAETEMGAAWQE